MQGLRAASCRRARGACAG